MPARITREVLFLEHRFSVEERQSMGMELAQAYNHREDIDKKEQSAKAQFKEQRANIDQSITTLSRNLTTGFEMKDVACEIRYDVPNVGEVSYYRLDTGAHVKTRAMTESERQMDLPLPANQAEAEKSAEQSQENISTFFDGKSAAANDNGGDDPAGEQPEVPAAEPSPDAPTGASEEADAMEAAYDAIAPSEDEQEPTEALPEFTPDPEEEAESAPVSRSRRSRKS